MSRQSPELQTECQNGGKWLVVGARRAGLSISQSAVTGFFTHNHF